LFDLLATLLEDIFCDIPQSNENTCPATGPPSGMATYNMHEMLVSLHIGDTPVGYTPPKGPPVTVLIDYNQREAGQPATFNSFNVSQKWNMNWLAYIEDDPGYPGAYVERYAAGGGGVDYTGYNSTTHAFTPETRDASVLMMTSASPITYQRKLADGGVETYAQSDGATSFPRHIFLTQITDPQGNSVTLHYDAELRLTSITDATGRDTTFAYQLKSFPLLITKITDPFGRSASLSYDSHGRLIQITDVLGLKSQFTYDASSLINSMTTPYGTTTFAYGDNGNERYLNVTDPLGYTERLEYLQGAPGIPYNDPPAIVPQGMIGPWNNVLYGRDTWYWDKHAYPIAAGNYTMARNRHWAHDAANLNITSHVVEAIKYPLENRVWMNYPGQTVANLSSAESGTFDSPTYIGRVLDDGTTQLSQRTYNALGHITDYIDPVKRETQFIYDTNQIDVLQVKQKTSSSEYSTIAQFTYNSQHLPLTYTDAAGQTTSYEYNRAGQVTKITDALGNITRYEYDGLGYLTTVINPNGKTQARYAYDLEGRIAAATDSEGYKIGFHYDNLDRIVTETFPDATTREYTWNRLDLLSIKDRQNKVTQFAHDAVRNLTQITDPMGHQTKFAYYENQTLKSLTDPNGNTTTWNIDLESRVTSKVYADGSQVTNAYENTTSRLHSVTDAMKQVREYSYAEDDALTGIAYENAVNATPNVSLTYDPYFRRVVSMTDGTGTTQYGYYPAGAPGALRLESEAIPEPQATISYQYDPLMRLTSRSIDGIPETYGYDKLSRLISHGTQMGTFQLGYLGQTGQLTSQIVDTGTVGTLWSYDSNFNDRRLKAITNSGDARSYQFTTAPENLITGITESVPNHQQPWSAKWGYQNNVRDRWTYVYDDDYRLTAALSSRTGDYKYEYDPVSNITLLGEVTAPKRGTYNELNEIIDLGQNSFTYDANGNLLDDGLRTYQWDANNRLLEIVSKTDASQATAFSYDGLGRRVTGAVRSQRGSFVSGYLWCGYWLCENTNSRTANDIYYYREGEFSSRGQFKWYFAKDQLASVRDVLMVDEGRLVKRYNYDPYGTMREDSEEDENDLVPRFAGMMFDAKNRLYLATNRAYAPNSAEWLTRDPRGERAGYNLYSYAMRNPIRFTDRDGLQIDEVFNPPFINPECDQAYVPGGDCIEVVAPPTGQLWPGCFFECVLGMAAPGIAKPIFIRTVKSGVIENPLVLEERLKTCLSTALKIYGRFFVPLGVTYAGVDCLAQCWGTENPSAQVGQQ
jgi:RHS repeat-associated protein